MSKGKLSRRNLLQGAGVASAVIAAPVATCASTQANAISPELLILQERLIAARAKRDGLLPIVEDAVRKRPPIPGCIERSDFKGFHIGSEQWRRRGHEGMAKIAETYEAAVERADEDSEYWAHNDALEAAVDAVGNIEREIIEFEPRCIADLRLQVELARHQEIIDHGMCDDFPMLICNRFLRLSA